MHCGKRVPLDSAYVYSRSHYFAHQRCVSQPSAAETDAALLLTLR